MPTTIGSNLPVWADAPRAATQSLQHDLNADACVIGLGGSGLAAIREFLEQGMRVVGLDASTFASGAAGRNGGFLLAGGAEFHHDAVKRWGHDRAVRIYHQTLRQIETMSAEMPDLIRRVGSLRLATSAEEVLDCKEQFEQMQSDGLSVHWHSGPDGEGLHVPTDAAFQPLLRCRRLADKVVSAGAELFENTAVTSIETGAVSTLHGIVRAPIIVVAVDGQMERVLPELAGRVRTTRLQMLATAPTDEVSIAGPVYARYGFEYWHQLPNKSVALGGLRDKFSATEWDASAEPSEALQDELEKVLRERVGVKHAPITHRWAGTVGYTPDYLPIVTQVRPGVWAIGGYCGTGNVVGAICGKGIAQLATTGDTTVLGGFYE